MKWEIWSELAVDIYLIVDNTKAVCQSLGISLGCGLCQGAVKGAKFGTTCVFPLPEIS